MADLLYLLYLSSHARPSCRLEKVQQPASSARYMMHLLVLGKNGSIHTFPFLIVLEALETEFTSEASN